MRAGRTPELAREKPRYATWPVGMTEKENKEMGRESAPLVLRPGGGLGTSPSLVHSWGTD